jgi:hypothetical protein
LLRVSASTPKFAYSPPLVSWEKLVRGNRLTTSKEIVVEIFIVTDFVALPYKTKINDSGPNGRAKKISLLKLKF